VIAWVCYWKVPVSTISRAYLGVNGGSVAHRKCQNALLFSILRRMEYASSNQGVGGSNPSGRTRIKDLDPGFFSAVLLTKLNSTNFAPPARVARLSTI
jgi:hypothetical protein